MYYSSEIAQDMYNSCADVVYPMLNQKAMKFVGGGAKDYKEWLEFLGTVKDKHVPPAGSPFQINFIQLDDKTTSLSSPLLASSWQQQRHQSDGIESDGDDVPEGIVGLTSSSMASCRNGPFACSCGDCPSADGCESVCVSTNFDYVPRTD